VITKEGTVIEDPEADRYPAEFSRLSRGEVVEFVAVPSGMSLEVLSELSSEVSVVPVELAAPVASDVASDVASVVGVAAASPAVTVTVT